MKKQVKKLVLAKETLRNLDMSSWQVIGALDSTNYQCTNDTTQTTGNCPSAGCPAFPTGYCPASKIYACFNTQQGSCTC